MARPKKQFKRPGPRVQFNTLVNEALRDAFLVWCSQRGMIASDVIEDTIAALLDGTLTINPTSNDHSIAAQEERL